MVNISFTQDEIEVMTQLLRRVPPGDFNNIPARVLEKLYIAYDKEYSN